MPEAKGTITIRPNGPYRVEGGVPLVASDGTPFDLKPAYSLCRCGKSANKPYCDKSHAECGFIGTETADPVGSQQIRTDPQPSLIRVVADGPYDVEGPPTLTFSDGRICATNGSYRLCRCGLSKTKPFCDDSHIESGFESP